MRFPHPDTPKICFLAENADTLIKLMGDHCSESEADRIRSYSELGLPPVTSPEALSVMFGYNPGFVWSLLKKPGRHYRVFSVPKGSQKRWISAPRVGLKTIQRWLNYHWTNVWTPSDVVHGFVPDRSHVTAAKKHLKAQWVVSLDIENFFPSVSEPKVIKALQALGYKDDTSLAICGRLICNGGGLTQGAPTSPTISNIVLSGLDDRLSKLAAETGSTYTRYADDIVFSGTGELPIEMSDRIVGEVTADGWQISPNKQKTSVQPERLKVHGLLVHGEKLRLTKGYRNRIRALRHLNNQSRISVEDRPKALGHISYADYIDRLDE